jgi:acyl-coenzyme A synthetase/AMP-(fatty) acid ligase
MHEGSLALRDLARSGGGGVAWPSIVKTPGALTPAPNLVDYERVRATFRWADARRELAGLPGSRGLNIAHEAIDRHAVGPGRDHLALRWLGKSGEVDDYSYGRLQGLTNRFANVLARLGVAKAGADLAHAQKFPALRFLASVGEPLNPEAVIWGQEAFGLPFHDNWWQTETGGIMIANFAALDIRPGSMGRPLPGVDAAIVRRTAEGGVDVVAEPDVQGELALRPGWPSMFRGYWAEPERYRKCFAGGFYLTGDLARRDSDGYFWFVGRADDVIKTSGHLIGPFEVESVLMEHRAVAEAGVIGKPDPVATEVVKAFVSLRDGHAPTPELRRELLAFARSRLGAVVAPKEIEFRPTLPKTRSGKIMRRLLRAQELGLPEGDTSTLETS